MAITCFNKGIAIKTMTLNKGQKGSVLDAASIVLEINRRPSQIVKGESVYICEPSEFQGLPQKCILTSIHLVSSTAVALSIQY